MKRVLLFCFGIFLVVGAFYSCKKKEAKETFLSGEATVFADESLQPIVEDQINVFENTYTAKLNLVAKPEAEIINTLIDDAAKIAILTRMLTPEEEKTFTDKGITPRITRFALDAVVFISNTKNNDSLIELNEVVAYIKGEPSKIKNLVFDNPNSGAVRLLHQKAGIELGTSKNIFSKSSSNELIKFISENEGYIGVLGVNWLTQTPLELQKQTQNIKALKVKNVKDENYYYPSQVNIGKKLYPLTREIYLLNYQGTSGLGMGFASFVASDIGQKIILTSGLAPMEVEQLKINIK